MKRVGDIARARSPKQVVVHASKTIVAVDCYWLNHLSLALSSENRLSLDDDVDVKHIFYADERVETQISFSDLALIVLSDSGRVDLLCRQRERRQLLVLLLLDLEFWHDERELGKLGLPLVFH